MLISFKLVRRPGYTPEDRYTPKCLTIVMAKIKIELLPNYPSDDIWIIVQI